jgi:predicted nucleotidyltransferase
MDQRKKHFSFYIPKLKFETRDIFVEEPKPFSQLDSRKLEVKAFGVTIPAFAVEDLIDMKTKVGRDKDLFDIDQLRKKLGRHEG